MKIEPVTIKSERNDGGNAMDVGSDDSDQAITVDEVTSSGVALGSGGRKDSSNNNDAVGGYDEVVREIPVFLSPELSDQIQLVQYPLQPNPHPTAPEAVRVKPRHCMMEIDLQTPSNIQFNGMYHMPSRTFASQTIPVSTHMALGKLIEIGGSETDGGGGGASKSNENNKRRLGLHLVPLSRMTQMRPSFSHVDEAVAASTATTEEELKRQEQSTAADTGRKSISFRKKESERQELARKSSYGYKKASEDAEGWHSLEVYDESSLQANLIMGQVKCPEEHENRNLLDLGALEKESSRTSNKKIQGTTLNAAYLNTLNYLPPRDDFGDASSGMGRGAKSEDGAAGGGSNEQEKLALVVTKLVRLMRQGRPIPFSLLRNEFPSSSRGGIDDTTLCVGLGSCAVLVRGNWCLNSKLLSYPPAMTQARTFLLCLFQTMRVVHRERLLMVFAHDNIPKTHATTDGGGDDDDRVTPEVIAFLLEQVGEKTTEGWVLKVHDDATFAERYPQTTLVHLQHWAKQIECFGPMIERYRADAEGGGGGMDASN